MDKERVIKNMRDAIETNKHIREQTNNALSHGIGLLEKQDGEYERGLNDAWELAKKVDCYPIDGGWGYDELHVIFDSHNTSEIFKNHTYQEALAKVKAYEKNKEEEAAKPKLGDVVEVIHRNRIGQETHVKGIYLQETDETHNVVVDSGNVYIFEKESVVSINKTGDFLDIPGTLRFIK